ncbi:MAG: TonB-dependent receptor [Cyclobacteriaceae bacterium]
MKHLSKLLILLLIGTLYSSRLYSQDFKVTGIITDGESGEPLIGATVLEQGTTNGTITDFNGAYEVSGLNPDAILVISYVGYVEAEIPVNGRTQIDVDLSLNISELEEIVVVGYGTQREKDLTSSISTLKAEELSKTPTSQAMQALQGKVAGVQIVSSGEPGKGPTVRVRGIGTLEGDSKPLYVVDGMFLDNIDFLNPADIQSISVLKDASAAAIYGVRAANGVILVETKKGAYEQSATVTYDGYYGVQRPQNVLEMANTKLFTEYALATGSDADAAFINNAFQTYGRNRANTSLPDVNTDWYDKVLRNYAPQQSHNVTVSGGTKDAKYSVGVGYFQQDGLVRDTPNSYERFNFRTNVEVDAKDWLRIGGTVNVIRGEQHNAPGSVWSNTYFAVPIIPVYDDTNTDATPYMLGNARNLGYRGRQNPFFDMLSGDDQNLTARILGNLFTEIELIPNKLTYRMAYNYTYNTLNARNVDFRYHDGVQLNLSRLVNINETTFDQIWDNILTYNESVGKHSLTVMAGYEVRTEEYKRMRLQGDSLYVSPTFDNEELWYFTNPGEEIFTNTTDPLRNSATGNFGESFNGISYFGRIAYNYDDKYLLYGTLRRDGTNKFQKKWGLFPTVGVGWVVSEEGFFDVPGVDFLKLRGSWGKLGNVNVDAAVGQPTYENQTVAIDDTQESGTTVTKQFDILDRWETTVETNVGMTGEFLDSRLSVDVDYYVRDTEDGAVTIILPLVRANVRRNLAGFRNQGLEVVANWSDDINPNLSYSVGVNFATLKNEVLSLGGQQYLNAGSAEFRQRSIVGQPIRAFFGYEVLGVFQNESQITNSGLSSEFIDDSSIEPGDFQYKDQNNDGFIDDLDRVVLGSFLPDFTYGFNLGVKYKRFDLSANFQGQQGQKILNRKRGQIIFTTDANLDADLVKNLWSGEGTSNKYPSAAGLRKGYNQAMSDYFVEDGSYFRVQNVRLTYTIPPATVLGKGLPDMRVILTAERPLTVFNYNGFNPEVSNGVDNQTYPIPAIYTMGLNIKI